MTIHNMDEKEIQQRLNSTNNLAKKFFERSVKSFQNVNHKTSHGSIPFLTALCLSNNMTLR